MILALVITLIISAAVVLLAACKSAALADARVEKFTQEDRR